MNNTPDSIATTQDQIPADLLRLSEAIHGLPETYAAQLAPLVDAR